MAGKISRKKFIRTTSLAASTLLLSPTSFDLSSENSKIKAIAFDAFPIFDPRPIFKTLHELFPEKSNQLIDVWQSKQFAYQWLRVLGNRYKDFWSVTKDALEYALAQSGISLSESDKELIMNNYKTINVWPDVVPSLQLLKKQNLKLGFLSNMTEKMLNQGIINSGTKNFFDFVISTDQMQTYKPSSHAYQMGLDILNLKKEEILFVPFAGWDMAGAKWFGYPTFWVNRLNAKAELLDAEPDGIGNNLNDLVEFVRRIQ